MKVLVVANANSTHTRKWCLGLTDAGCRVALFSIDGVKAGNDWFSALDAYYISPRRKKSMPGYLPLYLQLRKLIRSFDPDILHSHFLTNYTLLANLSGFKKHVATAWGSDVFLYAKKNAFTASLVKYNIRKVQALVSTSFGMAEEIKKLSGRQAAVIPFGIDLQKFTPSPSRSAGSVFTVACFKHLEKIYAPEILLEAFAIVCKRLPGKDLRLLLAGEGSMKEALRKQAENSGITDKVIFAGWVPVQDVPALLQKSDLCVYLSNEESFGVSLLEAMACRKALVVTSTVGFKEVAGEGGAVFCRSKDPEHAAEQMCRLIEDDTLRESVANAGYRTVTLKYDLRKNIMEQVNLYETMLKKNTKI